MKKVIKSFPNYSININGEITTKYNKIMKLNKTNGGYIRVALINKNGIQKYPLLHRLLFQAFKGELIKGMVIDHIDHNPLNNSLDNLQQITNRENISKDNWRRNPSSKYVGVQKRKDCNRYAAMIQINKKNHTIGLFKTEIEAHNAYQDVLNNNNNLHKYKAKYKLPKYIRKQKEKYAAYIRTNNVTKYIGTFNTINDALIAQSNAKIT